MKKHDSRADRISTLQKAIEDKIEDIYKSEGDNNKIDTLVQTIAIYSQELELQNLELQRVYETLEKSHKLYSSIFLNSPNGYVVCNSNLRVKEYSKFFEEGLKINHLEKDIHISAIIEDINKELFISNIKQLKSTSKIKNNSFESTLINDIPVKVSCEIIHVNNESLYLLIFTDIRKERESITAIDNLNKRLHEILDKIPFKIYVISKDHNVEFANKSLRDINGDYFGKKCYTYVNHQQQPCPWCNINDVFISGYNKRFWRSPIDNRSYYLYEYPITNFDSSVSKIVILEDITDLVFSQNQIIKQKELMRKAEEISKMGSFEFDLKKNRFTLSAGLVKLLGISKKELSNRELIKIIHPKKRKEFFRSIRKAIESNTELEIESSIIREKDGTIRNILVSGKSISLPEESDKLYASVRDITDEVRTRELQRVQYETLNLKVINNSKIEIVECFKEILKTIFLKESEDISIILFDNQNEFNIDSAYIAKLPNLEKSIASSLQFKRVFKERSSILLKGNKVTDIYNGYSLEIYPKVLLMCPIEIEDNFFGILTFINFNSSNGIDHTLSEYIKIITIELAKTLNKHSLVYQLIAEKENAQRSDMLKTTFLANMSHEIRTPLNSIIGFTQLIEESNNKEEISSYIKVINECSDRLLATINDIIDYSKIESGYHKIDKSHINICDILKNHRDIFKNQAIAKNISINISCSNYTPGSIINSDLTKINSIFTNLIKNAIKFTDTGEIIIGCKELENEYLFYVKDSGIGIPSEKLEMLFDRFYQVDQGKTRRYEGSGLGLPITKAYIELLGGKIWVETQLNIGTTVWFTLPKN